jgi:hypothetical protein
MNIMGQPDIDDYYRQLQEQIRSEILRESEEQIIGTEEEELSKYYHDKYALAPFQEDPDREASFDVQDYLQTISASRRERFYGSQGDLRDFPSQRVVVEVPLIPNKDWRTLAQRTGSQYTLDGSHERLKWNEDGVSLSFETKGYGFQMEETQMASEIEKTLQTIRSAIQYKNDSIEKGNKELLFYIKNPILARRQEIVANKEKLSALTKTVSIGLKKKPTIGAQTVRVAHTPLVQRIKPKPSLPEEYVLDESRVDDIITLLDNQARTYEQTPKAIKELGEENLRDLLLANLNSVFQGDATGETFSKKGKTDIYLKISKGNILIAECKIWGGKALYEATVDQLRGYLTWRHNYGIMITFVKNKDFTNVLRESEAAIQAHPSYMNSFKKVNETHFTSNHRVDDAEKEVKIHHLFYHLYTE